MSKILRFGVSIEQDLLQSFDDFCKRNKYNNRSEAIRDLIRAALREDNFEDSSFGCGVLTFLYDHHKHDLARKILNIQHDYHDIIIVSTHVHLDHENCLETLVLKGERKRIEELSQCIIACRGVNFGAFNLIPKDIDVT